MARQMRKFQRTKSIAGTFLITLGIITLHQSVIGAEEWFRHILWTSVSEGPGLAPAVIQAVSQFLQAYAAEQRSFLPSLVRHMFVSFWPLLLIMFGTVLSREPNSERGQKRFLIVDSTAGRSTSE